MMFDALYRPLCLAAQSRAIFAEVQGQVISYSALLKAVRQSITFLRQQGLTQRGKVWIQTQEPEALTLLVLACLLEGHQVVLLAPEEGSAWLKTGINLNQQIVIQKQKKSSGWTRLFRSSPQPQKTYPAVLRFLAESEPMGWEGHSEDVAVTFPSGDVLQYEALLSQLNRQSAWMKEPAPILFNPLPLTQAEGWLGGPLGALFQKGKWIHPQPLTPFSLDSVFNQVAAKRATYVILTPPLLKCLEDDARHHDYFETPHCQAIISVQASLDVALATRLEKRFQISILDCSGKAPEERACDGASLTPLEEGILSTAAEVFALAEDRLSLHATPLDTPGWDSLGHIRLIEAIEKRFDVRFGLGDIMGIASLRDLHTRILRLLSHAA